MGRTYPSEINRVLYMPGGDVGRECRAVALQIAEQASIDAEKTYGKYPGDRPRTGRLAKSYRVTVIPGTNTFEVTNNTPYAAAMEKGAKPHIIRARRTGSLQFRGRDGRWRKVSYVMHPGSLPRNTLRNAGRIVMRRRYGVG